MKKQTIGTEEIMIIAPIETEHKVEIEIDNEVQIDMIGKVIVTIGEITEHRTEVDHLIETIVDQHTIVLVEIYREQEAKAEIGEQVIIMREIDITRIETIVEIEQIIIEKEDQDGKNHTMIDPGSIDNITIQEAPLIDIIEIDQMIEITIGVDKT
jgi:hypothetical protein